MDKQAILSILGMLPDEKLMAALQVVAQQGQDGGHDLQAMSMGDDHIVPWGEKTVPMAGQGKGKMSIDPAIWLAAKPMGNKAMPDMSQDGETNNFLQTGGGV